METVRVRSSKRKGRIVKAHTRNITDRQKHYTKMTDKSQACSERAAFHEKEHEKLNDKMSAMLKAKYQKLGLYDKMWNSTLTEQEQQQMKDIKTAFIKKHSDADKKLKHHQKRCRFYRDKARQYDAKKYQQ